MSENKDMYRKKAYDNVSYYIDSVQYTNIYNNNIGPKLRKRHLRSTIISIFSSIRKLINELRE